MLRKLSENASIAAILNEIRPELDFATSQDFVGDGMLDSLDIMTLVSELDKTYRIRISGLDIVPENFRNITTIERLLEKYDRA